MSFKMNCGSQDEIWKDWENFQIKLLVCWEEQSGKATPPPPPHDCRGDAGWFGSRRSCGAQTGRVIKKKPYLWPHHKSQLWVDLKSAVCARQTESTELERRVKSGWKIQTKKTPSSYKKCLYTVVFASGGLQNKEIKKYLIFNIKY